MASKELKRMSRRELMDIIYQMKINEQQMQEEIASLQAELQDKRIRLSSAGSIADAAASITDVFSAAQKTADLYLQEITCMKQETEKECAQKIEEARRTVEGILSDGEKRYAELRRNYQADYGRWQQLRAAVKTIENPENKNKTRS